MLFDEDKNFKTILSVTRYLYYDQQWQNWYSCRTTCIICNLIRPVWRPLANTRNQNSSMIEPTSIGLSEKGQIPLFSYTEIIFHHISTFHIYLPHWSYPAARPPKDFVPRISSRLRAPGGPIFIFIRLAADLSFGPAKLSSLIPDWSLLLPIILGWR